MEKAMTLKEIATLAGVSLTTASRVVNDLPGVKPATRDRVLETPQLQRPQFFAAHAFVQRIEYRGRLRSGSHGFYLPAPAAAIW